MAYSGNKINLSSYELMKQLTDLKKEYEWLCEVSAQSLQQSIWRLEKAFAQFFRGTSEYPKFHRKSKSGSFLIPQDIKIKNGLLVIPRVQEGIKITLHRTFNGKIKQCTISKTATGKYFASILVETGEELPVKAPILSNTTIGVDVGLKSFLVASNGRQIDNPKLLRKSLSKLKYVQRKYSKYKGKRTRKRLARIHEKVANQRKDFLHKTSTKLIRENQTVAIEDLAVSNMVKNHKLALSISDAGWYELKRQLEYKADWYGKNILKIGRFEPSSKTCSACGKVNHDITLKDREWTCCCGITHDRDLNAAINIKNFALKNLSVERRLKSHGKLPELSGALTHEAHFE
jgi:putative transposase